MPCSSTDTNIKSPSDKKTMAIIAEYNPFHNGHLYQLQTAKELTKADYTIAVMGGSFLQRGLPALFDKYERATLCVTEGIDLCLELPFPYATGSAKDFARGAISLLDALNSIDFLCFGAETDDLPLLTEIAAILAEEPSSFKNALKDNLAKGYSFPVARENAICNYFDQEETKKSYTNLHSILSSPNNILAIEYLCALRTCKSNIKPVLIKRTNDYHERTISNNPFITENKQISSASAIRGCITNTNVMDRDTKIKLERNLPYSVYHHCMEQYGKTYPLQENILEDIINASIFHKDYKMGICDISPDLENKFEKITLGMSYAEIVDMLKSKDITATRIQRILLHMVFHYTKEDRSTFFYHGTVFYANILAFRKNSSSLLRQLHQSSSIPLITKKSNFKDIIQKTYSDVSEHAKYHAAIKMWSYDVDATLLYNYFVKKEFNYTKKNDYNTVLSII